MISFRYHLTSLIAVLLALGLGIVVGATLLNGPITKDLRKQVNDAKSQRDKLATQTKDLQEQVNDASDFASTYSSQLVANSLKNTSVLVVALPGATTTMQDGVTGEINAAGGKITGTLQVTADYLDQSRASSITGLATSGAQPVGLTLPETDDARQLGAAMLAYVLLGKGQPTDLNQVLSGFSQLHMIDTNGSTVGPATNIVVIGHGALPKGDYGGGAELDLVSALAQRGGKVVVAGDQASAASRGVVSLVRASTTVHDTVSSVDDADSAFGQVSAVLTLAAATKGQFGHYGTEAGADALFPSPNR